MSTPFENDFLSETPRWLNKSSRKRPSVTTKTDGAATILQDVIAAVPNLLITVAVMSAVSMGAAPTRHAHATEDRHVAQLSARPATEADRAWSVYLAGLERPYGRFEVAHVAAVRTVWERFQLLNPTLAPPQTAPTEEGALSMVWDSGPHHLEVDVERSAKVDWFYTNRDTGNCESGENSRASHLPRLLEDHIKRIS